MAGHPVDGSGESRQLPRPRLLLRRGPAGSRLRAQRVHHPRRLHGGRRVSARLPRRARREVETRSVASRGLAAGRPAGDRTTGRRAAGLCGEGSRRTGSRPRMAAEGSPSAVGGDLARRRPEDGGTSRGRRRGSRRPRALRVRPAGTRTCSRRRRGSPPRPGRVSPMARSALRRRRSKKRSGQVRCSRCRCKAS